MSFLLTKDSRKRVDISQKVCTNALFVNEISSRDGLTITSNIDIEGDLTVEGDSFGVTADFLATLGDPVNVSLASPPVVGQTLQSTSPTSATWQASTAEATVSGVATFSGPWASPDTSGFVITKIGRQVVMRLDATGTNAKVTNSIITSDAFIPVGFRPTSANNVQFMQVVDGSLQGAVVFIKPDGTIQIYADFTQGQFTNTPVGIARTHALFWTTD